ncbi:hypothetical protein BC937DRAFT_87009 [Endogone sp. FLAS-F59071]|nr:hypothetical protein BC937DRAFT_87009 [Endogone sp. FLAS-F59071]|eukprot:RUS19746.1 hypothetical protein BC937DRAFT_87009 [Endogone sp. FLAS-F59071]
MAEYVWHSRHAFAGATVLEVPVGSFSFVWLDSSIPSFTTPNIRIPTLQGTSLPSLILARLPPALRPCLIVTDLAPILSNIRASFILNDVTPDDGHVWVRELLWGEFGPTGVDAVVEEIGEKWPGRKIDWILGSDTFYDPKGGWW